MGVAGENLKFNEAVIDNRNGYNSTDFEYTIPVAGNWYFNYSFACDGEELKVQLQQQLFEMKSQLLQLHFQLNIR